MVEPSCPGCRARDARIATLEQRVAQLEALVRDLHARLGTNASNSSLPPSANPPQAPKPVVKPRSKRKPGGQPGHPPHLKQLLPPERVAHVRSFVPSECRRCHAPLPGEASPNDPPPTRFFTLPCTPESIPASTRLLQLFTQYKRFGRFIPRSFWFAGGHNFELMLEFFDDLAITAAVKTFY